MNKAPPAPVAYVMKRYPRLSETFIVNEIRAMERLGTRLQIFSLLAPEPPPHHPMVAEVSAPLHSLPVRILPKLAVLMRAHLAAMFSAPMGYGFAAWRACVWSIAGLSPIFVWKQFIRAAFVATSCRRAGVRHIHAHFANDPAQVAHFASLMSGIPFSVTAHAKDIYLTPNQVLRWRVSEALFVATCTGYNVRYLRGLLHARDHSKIRLVYHGIDISTFAPVDKSSAVADQPAAALPESPFLVLSVGRLVPKKGHDDLIAACALLRDAGHEFRCLIVGAGPDQKKLKALIDHHALDNQVELTGSMTHAQLIELYRKASLFALAPRIADDGDRDGIPNVIAEAMAIGVPVVSTKVSGIPEMVRDQQTGILVPPNEPKMLAAAIGSLIADPGRAARLARSAQVLVQQEFDLWSTTRQLHALLGCAACHAGSPSPATPTKGVALAAK